MDIRQDLEALQRNAIHLRIQGQASQGPGSTRFGGQPDVPDDFVWPTFEAEGLEDGVMLRRPLSFLAQFNCADMAPLDKEGLLPRTGVLSFFYETVSQRWGFDPKDAGCARVYWFADEAALVPAAFPEALAEECCFPRVGINACMADSVADWEDYAYLRDLPDELYETFAQARETMGYQQPEECSKLLGWPDIIQNNMTQECELIARGHYLGGYWDDIPEEDLQAAQETSIDTWRLLLQLDVVDQGDFTLMFGDGGRLYFYMRKEDLQNRRFDRMWLIQQCG
nr:YwqG family protein [Maliibacterium massiliense]